MAEPDIHRLFEGEVYAWIEDGSSIQFKAVSPFGDPVEFTSEMAREVGHLLLRLAEELDSLADKGL